MKWMMPENTQWAKEQNAHEPTRSYGQEIYDLTKDFINDYDKPVRALEIGAAWGVSAVAFAMAGVEHLISVDVNPKVMAIPEMEEDGFVHMWEFCDQSSDDFFEGNSEMFDLIYVDGSHKFPQCERDLFSAWDFLKPGGLLVADDFTHKSNQGVDPDGTVEYGVSYAVCRLLKEKHIKQIDTTTRLFMAKKI